MGGGQSRCESAVTTEEQRDVRSFNANRQQAGGGDDINRRWRGRGEGGRGGVRTNVPVGALGGLA